MIRRRWGGWGNTGHTDQNTLLPYYSSAMGRRLTPQEKKDMAYSRDHYVSAGESRHAFRKNWPKKKAMANQAHRHSAAEKIRLLNRFSDSESIENSPNEVTREQ